VENAHQTIGKIVNASFNRTPDLNLLMCMLNVTLPMWRALALVHSARPQPLVPAKVRVRAALIANHAAQYSTRVCEMGVEGAPSHLQSIDAAVHMRYLVTPLTESSARLVFHGRLTDF